MTDYEALEPTDADYIQAALSQHKIGVQKDDYVEYRKLVYLPGTCEVYDQEARDARAKRLEVTLDMEIAFLELMKTEPGCLICNLRECLQAALLQKEIGDD